VEGELGSNFNKDLFGNVLFHKIVITPPVSVEENFSVVLKRIRR
jgi:hypothetical protein